MSPPAHTTTPRRGGVRMAGAVAGVGAIVVAAAVAVPTLGGHPEPPTPTLTTARPLTVEITQARVPLSEDQLRALLTSPAQLGPLNDPARAGSCLAGLGYPATGLLGGRTVDINGRPAVVLVVPGERPGVLVALAVSPLCSEAHTGLVADTTFAGP